VVAGRSIEVLAVDGRAITQVRIGPLRDGTAEGGADRTRPAEQVAAESSPTEGGPGVASGAR
jgi:hypothetical protein